MAKRKKKGALNQVLGIVENVTGTATGFVDKIADVEKIYSVGKDVATSSSNAIGINNRKDKIRKLLIDIGSRVYDKKIEVNDRNVKAEIECIEELLQNKK